MFFYYVLTVLAININRNPVTDKQIKMDGWILILIILQYNI